MAGQRGAARLPPPAIPAGGARPAVCIRVLARAPAAAAGGRAPGKSTAHLWGDRGNVKARSQIKALAGVAAGGGGGRRGVRVRMHGGPGGCTGGCPACARARAGRAAGCSGGFGEQSHRAPMRQGKKLLNIQTRTHIIQTGARGGARRATSARHAPQPPPGSLKKPAPLTAACAPPSSMRRGKGPHTAAAQNARAQRHARCACAAATGAAAGCGAPSPPPPPLPPSPLLPPPGEGRYS